GLLAIGGDLSCDQLLSAYSKGIFPWFSNDQPILWWSPDPRSILYPENLHISKSLHKTLRRETFVTTFDQAFTEVIEHCACGNNRKQPSGTWITHDMRAAYCQLHELGYAHSVETWCHGNLVGGLYGVAMGAAFFGESMFSLRADTSKVALATLVKRLHKWQFHFIDCQVQSAHLDRMGATNISRTHFLLALHEALRVPNRSGTW
ncbi:MAG TPA: leucyl/phenylalanyl-tRNA--protein transferase, partial [Gammaproteobacteria bacterium]|nr:leucyl/phenylalanyl-tRNA--protein transferase [Gammaproteobacteria bacterium]